MTNGQQPELRWAPIPPKPKNRGRVWLIVLAGVLAVAIVAALLWFLVVRGGAPIVPPSPTPTATPTATTTPTAEPTPGETTTPSQTPQTTPPPVPDPDLGTFAAQVQPRLDDAVRGLGMVEGATGPDAVEVVDQLQQDAERFTETAAPRSISDAWYPGVTDYMRSLSSLRTAADAGNNTADALATARQNLQSLRGLVGL